MSNQDESLTPSEPDELQELSHPAEIEFSETGEIAPYISPTLASISREDLRPNPSIVCEVCPGSVWYGSEQKGLKCYCRVMHVISWSQEEPNDIAFCDGEVMANLERQKAANK